jgi:hypothetical protein
MDAAMNDTPVIANRGENSRAAAVSAKPDCMARAARTGDFSTIETIDV